MYNIDFTIRGTRPTLIARIFVSLIITLLVAYIYYIIKVKLIEQGINIMAIIFYILLLCALTMFVTISKIAIHKTHFNFNYIKIRHIYDIGPFTYKEKWQDLTGITYVSVFHTNNGYEANLWDEKKDILNLFVLQNFDEVMEKAFFFSEKLNVDLLDARKRGHHRWVNKTIYKETGKIEYIN